jgi:hypothetical protein
MSNSMPSKYLRMAAAETIIAHKFCNNIFRQYYLPESDSDRQALDKVLDRLSEGSAREEAIFRRLILSAYQHKEQDHITSVVASTISEVVDIFNPLLAGNLRDGFQSEFSKLAQEAVRLWGPIQRSAVRAWVCNDMEQDWNWGKYKDYDTAMGSQTDQGMRVPSNPTEPLFPGISIGDDLVCQGFALWSDQNAVVAAGIEYSQLKSPNPTHTRTGSGRGGMVRQSSDKRRLSSSGSTTAGSRQGDSPASPRNQSFADRVGSRNMTSP